MIYSFQITSQIPSQPNATTNQQTTTWKDFGDFSDLANIPIVGGIIASHSVTTHILHNEQGVFIPWSVICAQGSQYLLKPCNGSLTSQGDTAVGCIRNGFAFVICAQGSQYLLKPCNGSLTSQGDTAVGCIRNGFAAAAVATMFNVPFDTIKNALKGFAGLTGCGGIVDMDQIQNATELQYLLHAAASLSSKIYS